MLKMTPRAVLGCVLLVAVAATGAVGQVLEFDRKLIAADAVENARFGRAVAATSSIVVIGAQGDTENGVESGAAYIFDARTGEQLRKLVAGDAGPKHFFGISVAVDRGLVVVGASGVDDLGEDAGAAYVFDAETGTQLFKLLADDGERRDLFGAGVAIRDGLIAVGAVNADIRGRNEGAVYLFDAATGAQLARLIAPDGAPLDRLGGTIAIDRGVIAVSCPSDDGIGMNSGSVYLFSVETREFLGILRASDGGEDLQFGTTMDMRDGIVAAGSQFGESDTGSVYLFDVETQTELFKLGAGDPAPLDLFGWSVAVDDGLVLVGAIQSSGVEFQTGAVYLFDARTGAQLAKLQATDSVQRDFVGRDVAIWGGTAYAGADTTEFGSDSGSVYMLRTSFGPCNAADLSFPYGVLDISDLAIFIGFTVLDEPAADLAPPFGVTDLDDVVAFIKAFLGGCP
jgi:outer membrane protein assembly factor BamB